MKELIIYLIALNSINCLGQNNEFENWTKSEKSQRNIFFNLAKYIEGKDKDEISKDSLSEKYIYLDYVLDDTNIERGENRLKVFDTIFYRFRKIIDSLGVQNLKAKPIRFYKDHEIYEPFDEDKAKKSISGEKIFIRNTNVMACY